MYVCTCTYMYKYIYIYIPGWWLSHPSEKNMSSSLGMMTFPIHGKIHVKFMFPSPPTRYILGTHIYIYIRHIFLK